MVRAVRAINNPSIVPLCVCVFVHMCANEQRLGQPDDKEASKPAGASTDDDAELEHGQVPILQFPKSLNDFYKGKWY